MKKRKAVKSEERTEFGLMLEQGLREVLAHVRGEIELETVTYDAMPPARVKAIRKHASKSARDFEKRYHIPARTLEGWEQGRRKPDMTARILLRVIEREPKAVERALND
jgi:putative transcriptional regulator